MSDTVTDHEFEPASGKPDYCGHIIGCGAGDGLSDAVICDLGRAWHVRPEITPDWVPRYETCKGYRGGGSKHILMMIDGEGIREAWQRIFGEKMDLEDRFALFDGVDSFYHLYRGNRIAVEMPGYCEIYQYLPERKFD